MNAHASEHQTETIASPPERRKYVRYRLAPHRRARYLAQTGFQFGDGLLHDVSAGGVCLLVDRALAVGARLIVQLPCRRHGSMSRAARVLRVDPDGPGRWRVGCRLSISLSPED